MPDEPERLDVPAYSRAVEQGTDLHEVLRSRADHHGGRRFDARPSGEPFSYRYVTAGDERREDVRSHADDRFRHGSSGGGRLAADVHHTRRARVVEVRRFHGAVSSGSRRIAS